MSQISEIREVGRLAMLEAALYAAGRPVEIEALKRAVRTKSERVVLKLLRELAKRYELRESSLEVKELPERRVILKPKAKFIKMVKRYNKKPLLTSGPLKALSYIAYYQPVEQTKVILDLGVHVYSNLKMMEEIGLISRERTEEKGVVVRTTPYFADYFGFSNNPQKSRLQLRRIFNRMKIPKLDNGNGKSQGEEELRETPSTEPLMPEILADAGDGLPEGLAEYPGPAHEGSE